MNEQADKQNKILFWIDLELATFGIAKFLKEKYDCDLFAIIDISKYGKEFFVNQEIVPFKNVWYLRDEISKPKDNVDLDYLSSFEKKYDINLWELAFSDRYFYQFNPYYRFKSNEILSIMEQGCRFFEKVLESAKPDFLIMRPTADHQMYLLHEICKAKKIKILTVGGTRFGYRATISEDADKIDYVFKQEEIQDSPIKTFDELREYVRKYPSQMRAYTQKYRVSTLRRIKAALRFLFIVCNSDYRRYFPYFGRTRMKVILKEGSVVFKKRFRERFIDKHSLKNIDNNTKYVYFPLHFEPERAISIGAPFYTNQIEVIAHIAKSLPPDYTLYVKEHPVQVVTGWKSISYYKKILEIPNVHLVHTSISNEEMLKNCSLVVAIAGSAGLEAAFYNKPAIVLTDTIYSTLSHVHRLKSIEELPQAIRSSLLKEVDIKELNKFINFIEKVSFQVDLADLDASVANEFYYGGFLVDVKILEEKIISFLEKYRSVFEQLASEHIKKIKMYKTKSNLK